MHQSIDAQLDKSFWIDITTDAQSALKYCHLTCTSCSSHNANPVSLTFTIIINKDCTWKFYVGSCLIDVSKIPCLAHVSKIIDANGAISMFKMLQMYRVCPGNPDEKFVDMLEKSRTGSITLHGKAHSAIIDHGGVTKDGCSYSKTVRVLNCSMVIPITSPRCEACIKYRNTLRANFSKYAKATPEPVSIQTSSHTNLRYMSTQQRSVRLTTRRYAAAYQKRKLGILVKKLAGLIDGNGIQVDESLHSGLLDVMKNTPLEGNDALPEGSFKKLFWLQQLQASSVTDARRVRWHPLIVR